MKLKKKTSMMLVAASAVAVAGIAAVSFAAWTGSYKDTVGIAQAETGTINAFGFASHDKVLINEDSNKLVPYDQDEKQVKEGAYILTANLPAYAVYGEDYEINVVLASTVEANFDLYVQVADAAVAAPAQTATIEELGTAGWKKVTADEATTAKWSYTNTVANDNVTGKVLSMILVSSTSAPETPVVFDLNVNLVSASHNG